MSIRRKSAQAIPTAPRAQQGGDDRLQAVIAVGWNASAGQLPALLVANESSPGTGGPLGGGRARVAPSDKARFVLPEVERLRAEVERLQRQVADVSGELAACRASEDLIRSEHEANQQELDARLAEIFELAEEAQVKGELNAALQAARDEIKRRSEQDEAVLRTEYAELEGRFVDAEEARAATERDLRSAQRDVTEARERIQRLTADKNSAAERASAEFFELSEMLDDAQRRLSEALETVKAARAESAAAQVQMDELRAEGQTLRAQWAAMQGQIDALRAQVQSERESARGQDELDALKAELDEMRKGMAAATPEKYGAELRDAMASLNVAKVKRLLAYGANFMAGMDSLRAYRGAYEYGEAARKIEKLLIPLNTYSGSDHDANTVTGFNSSYDPNKAIAIMDMVVAEGLRYEPIKDLIWTFNLGGQGLANENIYNPFNSVGDLDRYEKVLNARVWAHARRIGFLKISDVDLEKTYFYGKVFSEMREGFETYMKKELPSPIDFMQQVFDKAKVLWESGAFPKPKLGRSGNPDRAEIKEPYRRYETTEYREKTIDRIMMEWQFFAERGMN